MNVDALLSCRDHDHTSSLLRFLLQGVRVIVLAPDFPNFVLIASCVSVDITTAGNVICTIDIEYNHHKILHLLLGYVSYVFHSISRMFLNEPRFSIVFRYGLFTGQGFL